MQKDQRFTLEDLSAATGMTARNVRAYQTKGLIPPPVRQGRRSVYGIEHLHRLQAIERARARGASLSLIASHLAEGRALDDDTLIGWRPRAAEDGARRGARATRADIGPLLAKRGRPRDPGIDGWVAELVAAGVFQEEGRRVYTGRDLAAALTALQRQGLPLDVALGVARRAAAAAAPVAEHVRRALTELEPAASTRVHLGDLAGSVVRHLVTAARPEPTDRPAPVSP